MAGLKRQKVMGIVTASSDGLWERAAGAVAGAGAGGGCRPHPSHSYLQQLSVYALVPVVTDSVPISPGPIPGLTS